MTGFLLAGIGNVDSKRKGNFLVVDGKTSQNDIEDAFRRFTNPDSRPAVGVLLLAQSVAGTEARFPCPEGIRCFLFLFLIILLFYGIKNFFPFV